LSPSRRRTAASRSSRRAPAAAPASTIGAVEADDARSFVVPHLERETKIYADEVQNVRMFGSENQPEAIQAIVDERLTDLRAMHEVTLEYHRIGAIKGQILDADGSVIYDLFTSSASRSRLCTST
jgi:hypothetical protein